MGERILYSIDIYSRKPIKSVNAQKLVAGGFVRPVATVRHAGEADLYVVEIECDFHSEPDLSRSGLPQRGYRLGDLRRIVQAAAAAPRNPSRQVHDASAQRREILPTLFIEEDLQPVDPPPPPPPPEPEPRSWADEALEEIRANHRRRQKK